MIRQTDILDSAGSVCEVRSDLIATRTWISYGDQCRKRGDVEPGRSLVEEVRHLRNILWRRAA